METYLVVILLALAVSSITYGVYQFSAVKYTGEFTIPTVTTSTTTLATSTTTAKANTQTTTTTKPVTISTTTTTKPVITSTTTTFPPTTTTTQTTQFTPTTTSSQTTTTTQTSTSTTTQTTQTTQSSTQNLADCFSIVEFHYDAAGNDNTNLNDEYVAIRNNCQFSIDMNGWTIHDNSTHIYTFQSYNLNAQFDFTIYSGTGNNSQTKLYWGRTSGAIWNNDGDTLFLNDQNDILIFSHTY